MKENKTDVINNELSTKKWFEDFKKNELFSFGEFETIIKHYIDDFETYRMKYLERLEKLKYMDLKRDEAVVQLGVLIKKYNDLKDLSKFDSFIDYVKKFEVGTPLYKFVSAISEDSLNDIRVALTQGKNISEKDICIMGIYKDDIDVYDQKDYFDVFNKEVKLGYISSKKAQEINSDKKEEEPVEKKVLKLIEIRKSNMEQKYTHTIRMLYMFVNKLNTDLYQNFPQIIKVSILIGVLFHDLGRFYQAAFYNDFYDQNLSNLESKYNNNGGEQRFKLQNEEKFFHSVVGFYFSLNSFTSLNSLESNQYKKIIDSVVAYAIHKHGLSNDKLSYLDALNLDSSFSPLNIDDLVHVLDELYKVSEVIPSNRGAFDLFNEDVFITNKLKYLFKDLETVEFDQDFFNVLFEILKEYKNSINLEQDKGKIKEYLCKNLKNIHDNSIDVVLNIIISKFKEIEEILSQVDYDISNSIDENLKSVNPNLELKRIVAITTLSVMDLDKIDILVQIAQGRMKDGIAEFIAINPKGEKDIDVICSFVAEKCREYDIKDTDFIYNTVNHIKTFHESKKNKETKAERIIYIPLSAIFSIAEKCTKENKNKVKRDLIFSTSFPSKDKENDTKQYFLFGEGKKSEKFNLKENFVGKLWWRIEQFILTNMRLVNSLEMIKELNVLDKIVEYYNNENPVYADVMKPIIYYAKKFIDVAIRFAQEHNLMCIGPANRIKEIRKITNEQVQAEMLELLSTNRETENFDYMDLLITLYNAQLTDFKIKNTENTKKVSNSS